MGVKVPVRHVHWKHCWRIIPTKYPSEKLLERVCDSRDMPKAEQVDELTSTRLRLERGELDLLPVKERATGPGSKYIMASFTYSLSNRSRFGDGSYGVVYGAKTLGTAIAETKFYREKFMRFTTEGPTLLPMQVLDSCLEGAMHDFRGSKRKHPNVYSTDSYSHSQALGRTLWQEGSYGIVYDSVRDNKGECVAVFKPCVLSCCRKERTLWYEWDGEKIVKIYELREFLKFK